jgi:hypothetical protein
MWIFGACVSLERLTYFAWTEVHTTLGHSKLGNFGLTNHSISLELARQRREEANDFSNPVRPMPVTKSDLFRAFRRFRGSLLLVQKERNHERREKNIRNAHPQISRIYTD